MLTIYFVIQKQTTYSPQKCKILENFLRTNIHRFSFSRKKDFKKRKIEDTQSVFFSGPTTISPDLEISGSTAKKHICWVFPY